MLTKRTIKLVFLQRSQKSKIHFFPDLEPEMGSQRPNDVNIDEFKIQNFKNQIFKFSNFKSQHFKDLTFQISKISNLRVFELRDSASILKYQKRKVATQTIPYERYGEILFQKVASGRLVPFVQDGPSKNAL